MPVTKHHLHSPEINRLAYTFKIWGHPTRLAIIFYLLENGLANNKTLVLHLGLSQSNVSQHLKLLQEVGLVNATPSENTMLYEIDRDMLLATEAINIQIG